MLSDDRVYVIYDAIVGVCVNSSEAVELIVKTIYVDLIVLYGQFGQTNKIATVRLSGIKTPTAPELSMSLFCVTRSNQTHQVTDPTRPNPVQLTMELTV